MFPQRVQNLFWMVTISAACTPSSRLPEPAWSMLQSVTSLSCSDWNLRSSELTLDSLAYLNAGDGYYLAAGKTRSLRPFATLRAAKSILNLTTNAPVDLSLQAHETLLGSLLDSPSPRLLLSAESTPGEYRLQLWSPDRTSPRLSSMSLATPLQHPQLVATGPNSLWLAYQEHSLAVSAIDEPIRLLYLDANESSLRIRNDYSQSFPEQVALGLGKDQSLFIGWFQRGDESGFKVSQASVHTKDIHSAALPITLTSRPESWAMHLANDRIYLAVINGDSMVGPTQLNFFVFSGLELSPKLLWQRSIELGSIHVGSPMWLSLPNGLLLLLPQWLEREQSLAVFPVFSDTLKDQVNWGVFPEGTTLTQSFYHRNSQASGIISRIPARIGTRTQICLLPKI